MSTEAKGVRKTGHQWQPGQSGNPGGRVKGAPLISNGILRLLKLGPEDTFTPANKADQLALQLYDSATKGDTYACREILDRTEGKVAQGLQLSTAELPTTEIVERLVEAFTRAGIDELQTRKVLLLLAGDDD
jgi:hypothetical protein